MQAKHCTRRKRERRKHERSAMGSVRRSDELLSSVPPPAVLAPFEKETFSYFSGSSPQQKFLRGSTITAWKAVPQYGPFAVSV